MEENAKRQLGGDKTLTMLILKLNKRHVLLYFKTYQSLGIYIVECK